MNNIVLVENLPNNFNVCYDTVATTSIPVTGTEAYYRTYDIASPNYTTELGAFTTGCTGKKGTTLPCCDKRTLEHLAIKPSVPYAYGKVDEKGEVFMCPYKQSTDPASDCGLNSECIRDNCIKDGFTLRLNPYQVCLANASTTDNITKYQGRGYQDCDAMQNKNTYSAWLTTKKNAYLDYLKTKSDASTSANTQTIIMGSAIALLAVLCIIFAILYIRKGSKKEEGAHAPATGVHHTT